MLRASLGISTKSVKDRLNVGLFTIFACVQPAFRNVAAVPREASRAHKSACPAITSSSASTSPSMCSKVLDIFSVEGLNFSALAPTELKTFFNHCTQRLPKPKHMFWSAFKDCCSFVFSTASASYFRQLQLRILSAVTEADGGVHSMASITVPILRFFCSTTFL